MYNIWAAFCIRSEAPKRRDETYTLLNVRTRPQVWRVKAKFHCVSTMMFANPWGKTDIKHSFESKTSQQAFEKFGKEREAALFSLQLDWQARVPD